MTKYISPMQIADEFGNPAYTIKDGKPYVRVVEGPTPHITRCEWAKSSHCDMTNFVAVETYSPEIPGRVSSPARVTIKFVCAECFAQHEERIMKPRTLARRIAEWERTYPQPKSAHADCDHPKTKSARAKCRRERAAQR